MHLCYSNCISVRLYPLLMFWGGGFNMVNTGWRGGDRRFRKISEEQSGNVSSSSSSRTGATLPGSSGFNGNPGVAHRTTLCVLPHCQSTC